MVAKCAILQLRPFFHDIKKKDVIYNDKCLNDNR